MISSQLTFFEFFLIYWLFVYKVWLRHIHNSHKCHSLQLIDMHSSWIRPFISFVLCLTFSHQKASCIQIQRNQQHSEEKCTQTDAVKHTIHNCGIFTVTCVCDVIGRNSFQCEWWRARRLAAHDMCMRQSEAICFSVSHINRCWWLAARSLHQMLLPN